MVSISLDLEARPLPGHFAVCRRSSGLASIRYLQHTETQQQLFSWSYSMLSQIPELWELLKQFFYTPDQGSQPRLDVWASCVKICQLVGRIIF